MGGGIGNGNRASTVRYNASRMRHVEFDTPEDIALGHDLAGPFSRFGGYALDRLILLLFQVMVLLAFLVVDSGILARDPSTSFLGIVLALLGFSEFLFFCILEWRGNGSTPGKRKIEARVVMAGGHRLTTHAVLVRNLLRPLDVIPLLWVVPLIDGQCRRLGDLLAGTLVVRQEGKKAKVRLPFEEKRYAELSEHHLQLGSADQGVLGPTDYHAVEEYLVRCQSFPPKQREQLAQMLLKPLLQRLQRPPFPHYGEKGMKARYLLVELYLALRDNPRLLAKE